MPNPDWEAKLENASTKFRKLGERAMQWVGARAGGSRAADGKAADGQGAPGGTV